MSFSKPFQGYHSHADPIWPDSTFNLKLKVFCCLPPGDRSDHSDATHLLRHFRAPRPPSPCQRVRGQALPGAHHNSHSRQDEDTSNSNSWNISSNSRYCHQDGNSVGHAQGNHQPSSEPGWIHCIFLLLYFVASDDFKKK
jgi:hypothetical protein